MLRHLSTPFVLLLLLLSVSFSNCEKETITKEITRDTTIIIKPANIRDLLIGEWNEPHQEVEEYSNGLLVSKKQVVYLNFSLELKSDSTYISKVFDQVFTGKWQLISPYYLVYDKGTEDERYYYILQIDEKTHVQKGPYTALDALFTSLLTTTYFEKP